MFAPKISAPHWRLAQNKWPPQNLHPLPVNNERSLISIFHKTFSVQIMFFLRRRSSVSNNVFMSVNIFFSIALDILSVCKQNALSKLDCVLRVFCSKCKRKGGIKIGAKPCLRKIDFVEKPHQNCEFLFLIHKLDKSIY